MNNTSSGFYPEISPKQDIVFKLLFGSIESEKQGILKGFLESILDIKIDSLSLALPTELNLDYYDR